MPISPTKSIPLKDIRKMLTLVYGQPKAGKSTLASQYPDACFIATEAGLNLLSVTHWQYPDHTADKPNYVIKTWEDLLKATAEVVASGYKTLILDTVGNACQLCEEHVVKSYGVAHKNDGDLRFGVGTALVCNELKRYFNKLTASGIGLVLIAHSMQRTIATRAGEIQKIAPFIPCDNKTLDLYNMVLGSCDLILYVDQEMDGTRVIRTKPHPSYDAGDRSGVLPDAISLPNNKQGEGSFAALYQAFYGKPLPAAKEEKAKASA